MKAQRHTRRFLVVAVSLIGLTTQANAADLWWHGDMSTNWGSFTSNFGTLVDTNFATDDTALFDALQLPAPGHTIFFSTKTATNLATVLTTNTSVDSIVVEGGPGNFSISGNTLILSSLGIINDSPRQLTINSPLATSGSTHFFNTANALSVVNVTSNITTSTINKAGPGLLVLSGNNSYPGSVAMTGGTLQLGSANALSSGKNLNLSSGTVNLNGFSPTIGDLNLGNGNNLPNRVIRSTAGTPQINLNGNLNFTGPGDPATIEVGINLSAGTHIFGGTTFSNSFYDLILTKPITGTGSIDKSGVPYTALTAQSTYSGSTTIGGGILFVATTNALPTSTAVTVNTPGQLSLTPSTTAGQVVAGNYDQTVASLSGTGAVRLGTAKLTVNTTAFTTFSGFIDGVSGRLTKQGTGQLTLTGTNTYSGLTSIEAGSISIGNGGTTGLITGPISIREGAALVLFRSNNFTLNGLISGAGQLTVRGATATLAAGQPTAHRISNLTVLSGALNLSNNDLIVDYTGPSPISSLIAYYNSAALFGNADFGGLPTYLAISEAADLGLTDFAGQGVDDTTVVLKYTYVGDANLDGQVDALDYERIDLGIGNTGVFGTAQGDLNYDGNVDALDYEQVDLNIGNGVGSPLATLEGSRFIPEPAALAPLAILPLLARRRR
jgi:autotransporter-associated beta strand protein